MRFLRGMAVPLDSRLLGASAMGVDVASRARVTAASNDDLANMIAQESRSKEGFECLDEFQPPGMMPFYR